MRPSKSKTALNIEEFDDAECYVSARSASEKTHIPGIEKYAQNECFVAKDSELSYQSDCLSIFLGGRMAKIVLVHGIAQEQKGSELVATEAMPAIVSGIQNAAKGLPSHDRPRLEALAERIRKRDPEVDVAIAFYGDEFLKSRTTDDDEKRFMDDLAIAMMERARDDSSRELARTAAARELQEITATGEAQGVGRVLGMAIEHLGQIRGIADYVMGGVTWLKPTLAQVSQYMRDHKTREHVRDEVRRLIAPDTRVLIGHSLGSVVAYDIARELSNPLPLLLTLGSPLGLREIIYKRIDPQPPTFPVKVQRWVNVADREDFIASTLDLRPLFSKEKPENAIFKNFESVNNGDYSHGLPRYLAKEIVGSAIAQAMMPYV